VRESAAAYTGTRWGDYSGTMSDPASPGTFWGIHEYTPGANSWNTWIGKYELPFTPVLVDGSKLLDGLITGGLVSDTDVSDDQYLELDPSPTTNPNKQKIDWIVQASSPSLNPAGFCFELEAKMIGGPSGDVIQSVRLLNLITGLFELVDTRAAATSDTSIIVQPAGDISRFIHPIHGETTALITWQSESFSGTPFFWTVDVDQVNWRVVQ
jgi:hypothetical protein